MSEENKNKKSKSVTEVVTDSRIVRKNNNEIGFKIKSGRLSLLARKICTILIWNAQDLRGKEDQDGRWCIPVSNLVKDVKFNSNDYDLFRCALDELQEVRVVRPRPSGGITSEVLIPSYTLDNVSHENNESLRKGEKKRGGVLMLWFMLPPELKHQLLDPEQYTRLPLGYMVSLSTIQSFELYQICRRYVTNPGGITFRDSWENWWFILTGNTENSELPEYKYAKRDVFIRAVTEINAITDIEIGLIEHKVGRSIREIQFSVKSKQQGNLNMGPTPIDASLLAKMVAMGVHVAEAERFMIKYSEVEINAALSTTESRIKNPMLAAVGSVGAYFNSALTSGWAQTKRVADEQKLKAKQEKKDKAAEQNLENQIEKKEKLKQYEEIILTFESMTEDRKTKLLNQFRSTLAPSNQVLFKKNGIAGKMLRLTFSKWLIEKGHLISI